MKIIIYNPYFTTLNQQFLKRIEAFSKSLGIITSNHDQFQSEFTKCFSGETIVVFYIGVEADVTFLEKVQQQFVDIKLLVNLTPHLEGYCNRIRKLDPRIVHIGADCSCGEQCSCLLPHAVQAILEKRLLTGNL